jgi:epoxyqueuosine reductase QueG
MKTTIARTAKQVGFDTVAFSSATLHPDAQRAYNLWIQQENHADMQWMERAGKSADDLLTDARSVICLSVNYYRHQEKLPQGHGRIARTY